MNPLVLYFASGESLYPGVLLLVCLALGEVQRPRWAAVLRRALAVAAVVMIVMACPPFPGWIDALAGALLVAWLALGGRRHPRTVRVRRLAGALLGALLVLLAGLEWPHRRLPSIAGAPCDHLTIVGDSISAGIDSSRAPPWPKLFEQRTGIRVKNLAAPGAQVAEGPAMAEKVAPEDGVVLLEIGGNDLIANTPTPEFEQGLDAILVRLARPGRVVVMMELPLLPHKVGYGGVQRRLAAKYGVALVPKRYFIRVIGGADATSDGLHLSERGAARMAALVERVLAPVLRH